MAGWVSTHAASSTVTCKGCGCEVEPLAQFPGPLCLDCYAKTPEANRPVTAEELAAMWGGPVRKSRRGR